MRASLLRRLDDRALPVLVRIVARATRRRALVGWLGAWLVLALVVAFLVNRHQISDEPPPAARSVTKVGPVVGTPIEGYLAGARRELAALAGGGTAPVYALVSLTGYGTPAQAAAITYGYAVSKAYFRVPLAGVQTEIRSVAVAGLRQDLEAHMRSAAARSEREASEADTQAARLTGNSAQEKQLRAFYMGSARVLRLQAREYRSLCACVYSFVVRATPQELTALARRIGVRVVDPAPEVTSLDQAVFLPVLPEQRVTVQPPPDTGLPALPTPSAGPT